MDSIEVIKPSPEYLELVKLVLEQNKIILITNKLLLEKLSCPPIMVGGDIK